ncbi:tellurite-resistance/dicarboxylate transporter family protein [Aspergillus clavatus NRRL 1]|uniref:C4-dicarboxylate transporter/malic acid transport protein, putative n=1 Tax=Aspergillus clavatus (strain ATCC 1007 / CBS 513.65 / DSM 816 / NCTC 3887 / NRRL 1 / QM 1276 / 107) TaxID=344612 RepID=A1C893_ASPCL|nr:C4-dicarboxylate transporter/malic acid transport protein, putative [Aspergillus clavatus NRRL 1]EAW14614.1 C4-dicarboxylate transporter/malic acid transport protein, putative [Aspergillus clavatus NRRL 1]
MRDPSEFPMKVSLADRLCRVTWGWYSVSMATGGVAILLSTTPHQFTGLDIIGRIIFLLNLVIFAAVTGCLLFRFASRSAALTQSVQDPKEGPFVATGPLALATIIIGAENYGTDACGPWLQTALRVVFWIYVAGALVEAVVQNWYLYHIRMASREPFALVRLFPSFPAMLSGTIASDLAPHQPRDQAIPILLGGTTLQGFGFLMSLFIYAEYFYRLNKHGLPTGAERLQMFIAVGPWSFTALALIGMAQAAVQQFPARYILSSVDSPPTTTTTTPVAVPAGEIVLILAAFVAVFLWTMAAFCLSIAVLSVLAQCRVFGGRGMVPISLAYWSMVFPNAGFVIATIRLGQVLQSAAILWVTSGLTICQVTAWLCVGSATVWAVVTRRMLWPEDEMDAKKGG